MSDKKVLFISDKLNDDALTYLKEHPEIEVDYRPGLPIEEKHEAVSRAHALIIRSATKVDAAFLEAASKLELVVRAGVGVDNVDLDGATRRGVAVQNIPDGNTRSAAEHTIALLMSLARNVPQGCTSLKAGEWERSKFVGVEVLDKKIGVVGLGKIGRHVATMANGLGFEVLAYDPYLAPRMAEEMGITLVTDVAELASQVDFLTVHVPKTDATRGLIGAEVLEKAKPGLRIVNCARGGIVDEDALLAALEDGRVAGAALDVYNEEPPENRALVEHAKVVCTPHLGASTREAQVNVAVAGARLVVDYFQTGKLHHPVNAVSLEPDLLEKAEPYGELARRLGQLHAQLLDGNPERVVVKFYGDVFESQVRAYVTSAVLVGFIGDRCDQPVNWINVRALAKDHGLVVEESDEGSSRYFSNMIRVEVTRAGGGGGDDGDRRELGGAMRGRRGVRLVSLDSYIFDAVLEGTMLIVANEDTPGMIGTVGQTIGQRGVNISNMSLGRHPKGGRAISLMNLDDLPAGQGQEIEAELAAIDGILWAKVARVD